MARLSQIKKVPYILEAERELSKNEQSVFTLQDLNPMQAAQVYDVLFEDGKLSFSIRSLIVAAELGIVGWHNVIDDADKPISFTHHAVKLLPVNILTEIGLEVMKQSFPEFKTVLDANATSDTDVPLD